MVEDLVLCTANNGDSNESGSTSLSKLNSPPTYIANRLEYWQKLYDEHIQHLNNKALQAQNKSIDVKIRLLDTKEVLVSVQPYRSTALDLLRSVDSKIASRTIAVLVDGIVKDAFLPIESPCTIKPVTFDDKEGQDIFWHSSAHILGEAMELVYGGNLCTGPITDSGFFYDMYMADKTVMGSELKVVQDAAHKIVKEKQPFERLVLNKDQLLELFKGNLFKQRIIKEKIQDGTASVYRCGSLIDLCRGPHIPNTGLVTCLKIVKNSSAYWQGDPLKEPLQRVYGISFPTKDQMNQWTRFQEEAAKRNHRKIGVDQELFFFNEMSPGSCFFLPRGAHIYNLLVQLMRDEYRNRGFEEVVSPNVFNHKLWIQSGHWEHYADNMFQLESENTKFALKPMNCPGHCIMYAARQRSWKELPIRFADFGVLHRNELSGALSGLTRVRRFQQDDAHIFCMPEQIKSEIMNCLDFMRWTYGVLGFDFKLQLSTRPEKFLGDIETWNKAEEQLKEALDESGESWILNEADGAFYGPKIDVTISDALKRQHQCATIQLDFQLPSRFNLTYVSGEDNTLNQPVMIHRAILGSIERVIGIVTEHYGGKWPFWISPRQACVISVNSACDEYAQIVQRKLYKAGFETFCKLDPTMTLNKRIRTAQLEQYNFILVVGENEMKNDSVNVRMRSGVTVGEMDLSNLIERFKLLSKCRSNNESDDFTNIDLLVKKVHQLSC